MPYEFYKVLHILGLILALTGLGAVALQIYINSSPKFPLKRAVMIYHGMGTLIVFVSGFGLMARIGLATQSWPTWIYIKITIWLLVLGLGPTLLMRAPRAKIWSWWLIPILLSVAVSAAVYKDNLF